MKFPRITITLIVLLTLLLAACGSGGGVRQTIADGASLPPPDTTTASGAYKGGSDYRIGAQDLLEISVFGINDLSKTVRVNSNGQISLPLIGGVMAGGQTIPALEKAIGDKLSKGYLQQLFRLPVLLHNYRLVFRAPTISRQRNPLLKDFRSLHHDGRV